MTTVVINTKATKSKLPSKDKLQRQHTLRKLSQQRKERQLRSLKRYIPLLPSETPSDVFHFWRQAPGDTLQELAFSYGAGLGAIIIQGLSAHYSWEVKDEKGKMVARAV